MKRVINCNELSALPLHFLTLSMKFKDAAAAAAAVMLFLLIELMVVMI